MITVRRKLKVKVKLKINVKLKPFLYTLRQPLRDPGFRDFQLSRLSAHEGVKFVSPKHRQPLSLYKYFRYSFLLETELTVMS